MCFLPTESTIGILNTIKGLTFLFYVFSPYRIYHWHPEYNNKADILVVRVFFPTGSTIGNPDTIYGLKFLFYVFFLNREYHRDPRYHHGANVPGGGCEHSGPDERRPCIQTR